MLYVFGFERLGVVISDLFLSDPDPNPGREGDERGVRVELRLLERGELESKFSAQPIAVGRPLWRVDLLESVAGPPGSFDRVHHHPVFTGWEPCQDTFDDELTANPLAWLAERLGNLDELLRRLGIDRAEVGAADGPGLRDCLPEIIDSIDRVLGRVQGGELARPRLAPPDTTVRDSWL